jgi:hypothetical protein
MILRFKALDKNNHQIATLHLSIHQESGGRVLVKAADSNGHELYQQSMEKEQSEVTDLTLFLNQALTKMKQIYQNPTLSLSIKID